MSTTNLLYKKQRFEFWKNHIDFALNSKVSIAQYCLDNNLKHSTFHGYKKKIYPELCKPHPPKKNKINNNPENKIQPKPSHFKRIEVKKEELLLNKNSPEYAARFLKEFLK